MRKNWVKKIIAISILVMFVEAGAIPIISGNNSEKKDLAKENQKSNSGERNIIFSDDFDDNVKDLTKWTETFTSGDWWERNQRTEFQLIENEDHGEQYEGTESSSFTVILSSNQSLVISADMISDIGHEGSQWVGYVWMDVTDGINFIRIGYSRGHDHLFFYDSTNQSEIYLTHAQPDGTWSNEIQIFSDKYSVKMNNYFSGLVNRVIFDPNPTLKVRMYMQLGGSFDYWWQAGFDNIIVQGAQSPLTISIIYPEPNQWIGGIVDISGHAQSTGGNIKSVQIKIDTDPWVDAQIDGIDWNYSWDTKYYDDGNHDIRVKCIDNEGNEGDIGPINVKIDNTVPTVELIYPIPGYLCLWGRVIFGVRLSIIAGPVTIFANVYDLGSGVSKVIFSINDIQAEVTGPPYSWYCREWFFGPITLTITANDTVGNIGKTTYECIKIF